MQCSSESRPPTESRGILQNQNRQIRTVHFAEQDENPPLSVQEALHSRSSAQLNRAHATYANLPFHNAA
jgi:hypothetical protein